MATKMEAPKFMFSTDTWATNRKGEAVCNICRGKFVFVQEVEVDIDDFLICPTCIMCGALRAASACERNAEDKKWLTRQWRVELAEGVSEGYLKLAKALRRVESFDLLEGGVLAVAIVRPNGSVFAWSSMAALAAGITSICRRYSNPAIC